MLWLTLPNAFCKTIYMSQVKIVLNQMLTLLSRLRLLMHELLCGYFWIQTDVCRSLCYSLEMSIIECGLVFQGVY